MQQKLSKPKACRWCGGAVHKDRLKECPLQGKECTKCGKINHIRKQCLSKSTKNRNPELKIETKDSNTEETDNHLRSIGNEKALAVENILSYVSTADLVWNKRSKR